MRKGPGAVAARLAGIPFDLDHPRGRNPLCWWALINTDYLRHGIAKDNELQPCSNTRMHQ